MGDLTSLVLKARSGDAQAYEQIVQKFQDMALSYAYSILGDYQLAEDVRQDAFLNAWCNLMALREPGSFPSWFKRIVFHRSLQLKRGRRMILIPLEDVHDLTSNEKSASQVLMQEEQTAAIDRAITALPDEESQITRMFYQQHLRLNEIGHSLNLPLATVKNRLHSARGRLQKELIDMARNDLNKTGKRKHAREAAGREAAVLFAKRREQLLHVPSVAERHEAGELLCAEGRLYRFMGESDRAIDIFEKGLAEPFFRKDVLLRTRLRAEIGITYTHLSQYDKAKAVLKICRRSLTHQKDNSALLASTLNALGSCEWGQGHYFKAGKYFQETLAESRRVHCLEIEASALNNRSLLKWKNGDLPSALDGFKSCLKLWRKIKNRYNWSQSLINVAILEEHLGRPTAARQHYKRAIEISEEIQFLLVVAAAYCNLSNLELGLRQYKAALSYAEKAIELSQQCENPRNEAVSWENLALAQLGLQDLESAVQSEKKAKALAEEMGDEERLFSLDLVRVEIRLAQARTISDEKIKQTRLKEIKSDIQLLRKTLTNKGYRSELPRWLRLKLQAEILADRNRAAQRTYNQALKESKKQGNRPEQKRVLALKESMLLVFLIIMLMSNFKLYADEIILSNSVRGKTDRHPVIPSKNQTDKIKPVANNARAVSASGKYVLEFSQTTNGGSSSNSVTYSMEDTIKIADNEQVTQNALKYTLTNALGNGRFASNGLAIATGTTMRIDWPEARSSNSINSTSSNKRNATLLPAGYNIFRADSIYGPWVQLNSTRIYITSYADENLEPGIYFYQVFYIDAQGLSYTWTPPIAGIMNTAKTPSGDWMFY